MIPALPSSARVPIPHFGPAYQPHHRGRLAHYTMNYGFPVTLLGRAHPALLRYDRPAWRGHVEFEVRTIRPVRQVEEESIFPFDRMRMYH